MDANTPINVLEPQFTQREAADIAGVDMKTINNWIDRGHVTLSQVNDRRLTGRRLFSIQDVAYLAVVALCTKELGLQPLSATEIASAIVMEFLNGGVNNPSYDVIHVGRRTPTGEWMFSFAYWDRETGVAYGPGGVRQPLPFDSEPFLVIPSSHLCRDVFLKCAALLNEDDTGEGSA
jgi:hypothetical protein